MKIERGDFEVLVERAMQAGAVSHMRSVIEKELLHHDILFCLDQAGLLDDLVFQGGTSLRLCHGGNRYSENLDFTGGLNFSSDHLVKMKSCIEEFMGARYNLEVIAKEPDSLKREPEYADIKVDMWQVAVITSPERRDMPKQRIKIEVANIPAYTREPLPLRKTYDFLPDGYEDTLVYTETLDEIMSDKLVSLPATRNRVRHRDIWDLAWLKQQGAELRVDLVAKKIIDYRLEDFSALLEQRCESIPATIHGGSFKDEMRRFLPSDVFDRTLANAKFTDFLVQTLTGLLALLKNQLNASGHNADEFKM